MENSGIIELYTKKIVIIFMYFRILRIFLLVIAYKVASDWLSNDGEVPSLEHNESVQEDWQIWKIDTETYYIYVHI